MEKKRTSSAAKKKLKLEVLKKVYKEFTFLLEEKEVKKMEEELNSNNI